MHCACTGGNGLAIHLCDFHARVLASRQNRLLLAVNALVTLIQKERGGYTEEIEAVHAALGENGVGLEDTASPVYAKKAHFLLRRAYDALAWCSGADDFQKGRKAHKGWQKDIAPLLEELRKVFNPKEKAANG